MEAPPDNDVLWARSLHFTHRDGSPALQGVSLGVREGDVLPGVELRNQRGGRVDPAEAVAAQALTGQRAHRVHGHTV
ncbi:hypothetical protein QDK90_17220, partial [Streptomyces sp. 12257]|nr:hypothetical protein [Streptomyces sp. 12257]